jgi:microcystin-dependent protein
MSNPYIGEVRLFAGNFAPQGWSFCNGALLPISDNDTLFALIGTTYGGDGEETFALPDLRGRVPMHMDGSNTIGETGGVETVTLTSAQNAAHTHPVVATTSNGTDLNPNAEILATTLGGILLYRGSTPSTPMGNALGVSGGSQPHNNMQQYLAINYIISLYGIFPSPT